MKKQTAPVIQQTNELDDKTAANNRALQDLDKRTSAGIQQAQSTGQNALTAANGANTAATHAGSTAQDAVHRADSLNSVVQNLDTYQKIDDVSVTFGLDKAELTRQAKAQLDGLGAQLAGQKSYILSLTGGADASGSAAYNYALSDRRADAVVQYLAAKYGVPAHRFYLIGLGKDVQVASNSTAAGRAKNRRVEVQLMTNQPANGAAAPDAGTAAAPQQ